MSALTYTVFDNVTPKLEDAETFTKDWKQIVNKVAKPQVFESKKNCPLISLARYGDLLSPKGCIRHAENVQEVFGIEGDYDNEVMSIDEAAKLLTTAKIKTVLYTSPSHTKAKPRWRVLAPLSKSYPPAQRTKFVGRLNRVLGGVLARESFTLSQSYFIGRVKGVEYKTRTTRGTPIDLHDDIESLHYEGSNGADKSYDTTTDAELRARFKRGEDRYQAMLKLSARWATRGMDADDIEASLSKMLGKDSQNADGIDLSTRVHEIAKSAVRKFGETRSKKTNGAAGTQDSDDEYGGLKVTNVADITPEVLVPLLPGMFYKGKLTSIAGLPGDGKSLATLDVSARMSTGSEWPVGKGKFNVANVLLLTAEDDPADTIRPRLDVAGADNSKIDIIGGKYNIDEETKERVLDIVSLIDDLNALERLIEAKKAAAMFIDPLSSFADSNTNETAAMRRLFDGLAGVARRTKAAIGIITHFNKRSDAKIAMQMIAGSHVIAAACRVVLATTFDPADKTRRLILPLKLNIGPGDLGFAFRIKTRPHLVCGEMATIEWENKYETEMRANDVMIDATPRTQAAVAKAFEVQEWLRDLFKDGQSIHSKELFAKAMNEKRFTENRVRTALTVLGARGEPGGFQKGWVYTLPAMKPRKF